MSEQQRTSKTLVERLRTEGFPPPSLRALLLESADEIERLQREHRRAMSVLVRHGLGLDERPTDEPQPSASNPRYVLQNWRDFCEGEASPVPPSTNYAGIPIVENPTIAPGTFELRDDTWCQCKDCDLYCHCCKPVESMDSDLVCGNCGKPFHDLTYDMYEGVDAEPSLSNLEAAAIAFVDAIDTDEQIAAVHKLGGSEWIDLADEAINAKGRAGLTKSVE